MKIVFESDFGRVWSDNHTPCMYILITGVPPANMIAKFSEAQVDLSKQLYKQFGEAYVLSDFSRVSEQKSEQLCLYYLEMIPKLIKNRISYVAFVCAHKSMDSIPSDKRDKIKHFPIGLYASFTEALASINVKRSLHLNRKFASVL